MKITIVSGARPHFMKIAPLCRAIETAKLNGESISYRVIYTGKCEDANLGPSLFEDLSMRHPDACLGVDEQGHSEIAAKIMVAFEKELDNHPTDIVLVVDDMTATMSCSIVAKKRGIKVAHVIAGTRSFDMNMPREVNRTIVDAISDYLFTAGMVANRNLNREGMEPDYIYYVGNILIDNIRFNRKRIEKPEWFDGMGLKDKEYLLLTINRKDLLADGEKVKQLIGAVIELSKTIPVIAPLHSYVAQRFEELGIQAANLHIMSPQSYLKFAYLINSAKGIITDSGNIAEEATFLDVPCITLNSYAEHPETWRIGTNVLVGEDRKLLQESLRKMLKGEWRHAELPERWDGRTAERIIQTLIDTNPR